MFRLARSFAREPQRIAGILWPLALLGPFVPGLPRPSNFVLTWRQESIVALLLTITFALLWRRALRHSRSERAQAQTSDRQRPYNSTQSSLRESNALDAELSLVRGRESSLVSPLAAFVLWGTASTLWAANLFPAVHYALCWTLYLLFFASMLRVAGSLRTLRSAVTLFALVIIIICSANIVGHYGSPDSIIRQNGLGEPVAVSIPLFAALALRLRRRRAALLCGAAATLGWLSMLEIAERAPLFGVLLGLFLLAVFALASPRFRPRNARRALALSVAFAACLALQLAPSPFAESRHENVLARVKETSAEELNTRARLLYWGAALEMWRARPLTGVGAGGYNGSFPSARASFAVRHPDSPLVQINESYLSSGAHSEYLQILGELGAVGFALFAAFCVALTWAAWRALRKSRSMLAAGAVASLAAFAVSSGASSISFRWFGSGLVFFFAAALVTSFARYTSGEEAASKEGAALEKEAAREEESPLKKQSLASSLYLSPTLRRRWFASPSMQMRGLTLGCAASLVAFCVMCVQAASTALVASAQASASSERVDRLYRSALNLNPLDAATHFDYGVWLVGAKREREALPHLRYALAGGFHTSSCYEYLAGAESNAGDTEASERTLAEGVNVYPRSVFMRTRHASALARLGRQREADVEMSAALLLDSRAARGWRRLIDDDIDAAIGAAKRDPSAVAIPGELQPEDCVFAVLEENERRFPEAATTGWRAQIRSVKLP